MLSLIGSSLSALYSLSLILVLAIPGEARGGLTPHKQFYITSNGSFSIDRVYKEGITGAIGIAGHSDTNSSAGHIARASVGHM